MSTLIKGETLNEALTRLGFTVAPSGVPAKPKRIRRGDVDYGNLNSADAWALVHTVPPESPVGRRKSRVLSLRDTGQTSDDATVYALMRDEQMIGQLYRGVYEATGERRWTLEIDSSGDATGLGLLSCVGSFASLKAVKTWVNGYNATPEPTVESIIARTATLSLRDLQTLRAELADLVNKRAADVMEDRR